MPKKLTQEQFIERCKETHQDKYDLSKVVYKGIHKKIEVICNEHGSFWIEAKGFATKGHGCGKCGNTTKGEKLKLTQEEALQRIKDIHGDKFSYPDFTYISMKDSITAVCNTCGHTFKPHYGAHVNGTGCPKCAAKDKGEKRSIPLEEAKRRVAEAYGDKYSVFWEDYINFKTPVRILCTKHNTVFEKDLFGFLRFEKSCPDCVREYFDNRPAKFTRDEYLLKLKEVHGDTYDFSLIPEGVKSKDVVKVVCKDHGVFEITLNALLLGNGCKYCNGFYKDTKHFIQKCEEVHGDAWDHSNTVYKGQHEYIEVTCNNCGHTKNVKAYSHLAGTGCPSCSSKQISSLEMEVVDYIRSLGVTVEQSVRGIVDNRSEVDIYIPDHNLAIEFNGLYWHSANSLDFDKEIKDKHLYKTLKCLENEIHLLHIFENEWLYKKEIWKSVISNKLGFNKRIYARKCEVKEVDYTEASLFLEENHLQGSCVSKVNLGLYYKDDLVSIATFSKPRYSDEDYELIRLCSKKFTSIVGGASKLIAHFKRKYAGSIVSYANRRWSEGNVYEEQGFKLSHITKPCYYYYESNKAKVKLEHRSKYQKHKLPNLLTDFNPELTEAENMFNNGFRRIWDCGNLVYILTE